MKKIIPYLNSVMFCLVLLVLSASLILTSQEVYSEREKRYLAGFPELGLERIMDGDFQSDLEDWIADQFPFRDGFVGIHAYWNLLIGQNTQQDIYYADQVYLINAPAAQDLTMFHTTISRFDQFASNCGVPVSMIMVPSTGYLKQNLLPIGTLSYPDAQMFVDLEQMTSNLRLIDIRSTLQSMDGERPVCYRTDHHLSAAGNYAIYQQWCMEADMQSRSPSDYEITLIPGFYGTTWSGSGYWLIKPDTLEIWDSGVNVDVTITDGGEPPVTTDSLFYRDHLQALDMYPVYLDGNHCEVEIINHDAPDRSILLIKDSYAHCFATFLTEQYSHVYLLDLRYYRGSITDYISEKNIDEVLFFYGTSTLLTDSNSAWLF